MTEVSLDSVDSTRRCPHCGRHNVRPSFQTGVVDTAVSLVGLEPMRCRSCRTRFFRFGSRAKFLIPIALLVLLAASVLGYNVLKPRLRRLGLSAVVCGFESSGPRCS